MREAVTEFSLMLRVCVGRGDRMLALINIMYVCGKGRYNCLHQLILHNDWEWDIY